MRRLIGVLTAVGMLAAGASSASAQVLRVGAWHHIPGQFSSIQNAVNAARPGDSILVAPGDYKTTKVHFPKGVSNFPAAVLITTGGITLRGMNRAGVMVDGTVPRTPRCSNAAPAQSYGPSSSGPSGSSSSSGGYSRHTARAASDDGTGLNGVEIYKAPNVTVQNLSTCNFLGGSDDAGNGIWWNGGDNTGVVGGFGYTGSYLTATSTFFNDETTAAQYGIFSSNWDGGTWDQIYASNFNDSGFYIGACQQQCNQTLDHGWSEYNALGYSGTNSGGALVVENSQFDHNEDGFDTNSQDADPPPPQNGACPNNGISPITHTHSCWVFMHNYVHDNNNPNVPSAGSAAAGPVGTGMSVSGSRNDTIMDNTFANNDAWGFILVPYPDSTTQPCTGGTQSGALCVFDESGDAVLNNTFVHNGSFGNNTNGDIGFVNTEPGPTNCFAGNTDSAGLTTSPAAVQTLYPTCDGHVVPPQPNPPFLSQVACDSESIQLAAISGGQTCPPVGANYPRHGTGQPMPPVPSTLPTMPHPCGGVTADPWCSGQVTTVARCAARSVSTGLNLAVRERFVSVNVRVADRRSITHKAKGRRARVRFFLTSARHRTLRVRFVLHLKVGKHREKTTFTRIYHRC
jgi:hypothetical protein